MSDARESQRIPQEAPWMLPVSMRAWLCFAVGGAIAAFLIMGLVYEVTQSAFVGSLSVAEATGFAFLVVYLVVGIGPLSPFRARRKA